MNSEIFTRISNFNRLIYSYSYLAILSVFTLTSNDKQFIYQNDPDVCGIYCVMSQNYFSKLAEQDFDAYYFQKSLVSLVTSIILMVLDLPSYPQNINNIQEILSLSSLFVASFFWWKICNVSKLATSNYWLVFIGLFGSQLFVKISPYAQDGSDNASFSLGMATLYFIVIKSHFGLWSSYIVSFLVQPQLRILIIPLIVFYQFRTSLEKYTHSRLRVTKHLTGFLYFLLFTSSALIFLVWLPLSHGVDHAVVALLPFSIVVSSVLLGNLIGPLVLSINIRPMLEYVFSVKKTILVLVLLEISFRLLIYVVAKGEVMSLNATFLGQSYFLLGSYFHAIALPILWLIAPILFFGPVTVLLVIYHRLIFTKTILVENYGLGISLVLIIILLPNTESRHHIAYLPWLLYILVNKVKFSPVYVIYFFTPLMLVTSRFYGHYASTNLPSDKHLMSWGPWMDQRIYFLGTLVVIPIYFIHFFMRRRISSKNVAPIEFGNTK